MMDGQDMNLVNANYSVDDTVWPMHNLANSRILELRNGPTGLWKGGVPISGGNELGDYD
jgi:hypothetical protein